ncbi:MAG TPA: aminodeoxychorismate/anthranilate synthase component II [Spirochaetota bacterium]|nr:aminodeoxychorismate/anthranilate synthase component II [Spirochaetota bacterium]HOM38213.1 aminodeoxychorismate/anthranilate synthase component II [Spirochaetota bacterium]HPQ48569.1 aminodeoxychorismate/anthranilate synthase component II [Spirochaetota bacterium]
MFLLVDNYDSFTYNLYALFKSLNIEVKVVKNREFIKNGFEGIIISPGPSHPKNSGLTLDYIDYYKGKIPIFGVCLGMQAICHYLGYKVDKASTIQHGKKDTIIIKKGNILLKDLPKKFYAVRYHSLSVKGIDPIAVSETDNEAMAFEDSKNYLFGVQFHPESFLSEYGIEIATNFIKICKKGV